MLIAVHSVAGGVVGRATGHPLIALFSGVVLHLLLDATPHFDQIDRKCWSKRQIAITLADALLGLILIYIFFKPEISAGSPFVWGVVGGNLVDMIDNVPLWGKWWWRTKWGGAFHHFHYQIQRWHNGLIGPPLGLALQYIIIAILIILYRTS